MRYFIDCEFDGHNGPLLSMAIVPEEGASIHIEVNSVALDMWVRRNVVPLMSNHEAETMALVYYNEVGREVRTFIGDDPHPVIIADSPVDIARFCQAISNDEQGLYATCMAKRITFEVHDIDCYPTTLEGAVQHNAWWDAMALREKLALSASPYPSNRKGNGCE